MSKKRQRNRRRFLKQLTSGAGLMLLRPTWGAALRPFPPADYMSNWQGNRAWIGPEYWASPMQDWRMQDGVVVTSSATDRVLQQLTHVVSETPSGSFYLETRLKVGKVPTDADSATRSQMRAGLAFGLRGKSTDYRSSFVTLAQKQFATMDANGRLYLLGAQSDGVLSAIEGSFVTLRLDVSEPVSQQCACVLTATDEVGQSISVSGSASQSLVRRSVGLYADGPATDPAVNDTTFEFEAWEWQFQYFKVGGSRIEAYPERTLGPIFSTQYTLSRHHAAPSDGHILKLSVQLPPLLASDSLEAVMNFWPKNNPTQTQTLTAAVDALASVAVFRVPQWDYAQAFGYRVAYDWQGNTYEWEGSIRAEPTGHELKLAALSCDSGYNYPNTAMVATVTGQSPDMLFFAGDQFYEASGLHGIIRAPTGLAMRCYLGKYLMFCANWQHLLKDRPSVIIPDDHDVFQGNLWGHGGRKIPGTDPEKFGKGGYTMPAAWVNAVQKTQTAHLPDPYDPTPVLQGIGVYYTAMTYGGVSFAILEDRKWKTGMLQWYNGIDPDVTDDPYGYDFDHPEAVLLGQRQHDFIESWSLDWQAADLKCILTQTPPAQLANKFSSDLTHGGHDFDSNGWPQTGRNDALKLMRKSFPFIVSGDQHLGALAHMGVDAHEDACVALCVPGTATGFPRAWWPDAPGEHGDPKFPDYTGRYQDPWGNKFTMLAIANPEHPDEWDNSTAETLAHDKGSGHGLVTFNRLQRSYTSALFRVNPADMFPGFPKTVRQLQNFARQPVAWLPWLVNVNAKNPVLEVYEQSTSKLVYALRLSGSSFKPPVYSAEQHMVVLRYSDLVQTLTDLLPIADFYDEASIEVTW